MGGKLAFTLPFGSLLTAHEFQRVTQSITSTTIGTTTIPPIWNVYRKAGIKAITHLSQRALSESRKVLTRLVRPQKHGTEAKRASNGTPNTLKTQFSRIWFPSLSSAGIAASTTHPRLLGDINIAPLGANNDKRTGFQLRQLFERAKSALVNFRSNINEAKQIKSIALAHVRAVRITSDVLPVYNLSVEEVSEYFANGILVRNCDALRMFAVDYALPESTPKTIAEEVQDRIPEKHRAPDDGVMTPEQQMSHQAARAYAEEVVKIELGLDDVDYDEDDEDYD
jgi:hypothetical protein